MSSADPTDGVDSSLVTGEEPTGDSSPTEPTPAAEAPSDAPSTADAEAAEAKAQAAEAKAQAAEAKAQAAEAKAQAAEAKAQAAEAKASAAAEPSAAADATTAEAAPGWRARLRRTPIELAILTVLAAVLHFALIYSPRAIVFDEVYFREYSLHYKAGTFYFDVHPPLGKLLLGAWAAIAGVGATALDKDPAVAMRLLPAFCGTLLIPILYILIRKLSGSRRIATLGAAMLLFENAILVESRLILMDSILLLFCLGAITLAVIARDHTGRSYWWLMGAAAAVGGLATATKVTGLTSLAMVGLIWLFDSIRERRAWRPLLGQAAMLAVLPFVVYASTFAIHFAFLTKSGGNFDAYMSQEFQATLKGNQFYKPDVDRSFPQKFMDLNKTMQASQISLNSGTHPYATKWWSWPIMKRGVYLYLENKGNGKMSYIYTLGNPIVWWGTLLGAVLALMGWIARPKRFSAHKWPLIFLGIGWIANYLPFALIERPMFLYHYFFALVLSIAFVSIGIGALTGWIDDKGKPFRFESSWSRFGYWGILGAAMLGFLFFAPLTFGTPLTEQGLNARMWLDSWR